MFSFDYFIGLPQLCLLVGHFASEVTHVVCTGENQPLLPQGGGARNKKKKKMNKE